MSDLVTELHIVGDDNNIFDTDMEYIIPLYQRAYAWGDKQLVQLIEDINDVADDASYYIGALIVSRQGNKFEVVDGQQRLTSLYLLLNCLGYEVQNTLTFACRDKSNYTLQNIQELIQMNRSKLDMDRIESGIQSGIKILMQEMQREGFDYKENHTLCVWSKKTFRDGEKKTSNDIIKVAGNRKNYNQRRTLNER